MLCLYVLFALYFVCRSIGKYGILIATIFGEWEKTHSMSIEPIPATQSFALPSGLPILRVRATMRLLEDAVLPRFKGAMLRGGFGYAFQRAACPEVCWNNASACTVSTICPYRWVFETPHPAHVAQLQKLRDVPRPFVINPPSDHRTHYEAGDALEFELILIGRSIDYIAYFLFAFEQLGRMGLGKYHTRARLEQVEALQAWQPMGVFIYQNGQVLTGAERLPTIDEAAIEEQARAIPADMQLSFPTPLRLKRKGDWIRTVDLAALVQAMCWRINTLSMFHGAGPWQVDHWVLVEQAREVVVTEEQVQWVDWGRTSRREGKEKHMILGGLVGSVVLRNVPLDIRTLLLAGSLLHVGKACVFGHGAIRIDRV